jgi:hypothetical protein
MSHEPSLQGKLGILVSHQNEQVFHMPQLTEDSRGEQHAQVWLSLFPILKRGMPFT